MLDLALQIRGNGLSSNLHIKSFHVKKDTASPPLLCIEIKRENKPWVRFIKGLRLDMHSA